MHFLYLLNFWQYIQPFDLWLIKHINQDWSNPFLDSVLPFFRETLYWIPLYLFLILFTTINFKVRGWWWVGGFLLTAAISDLISSQFIKQVVMRTRPCQDLDSGTFTSVFYQLLPGKFQLYFLTCYQSFCAGGILFSYTERVSANGHGYSWYGLSRLPIHRFMWEYITLLMYFAGLL